MTKEILDTGAQGPKSDEGDTGPQKLSGCGDSADLLTVLLFRGTQIMTGTLYMNSEKFVILGDHQVQEILIIKSMLTLPETTH